MLLEVHASGPLDTNTYILGCLDTKKAVVIDAPLNSARWISLILAKHTLTLQAILLTHSHWDHIGDVAFLKEQQNVPVYIHSADVENLRKPGSDGLPLYIPIEGVEPDEYLEDGQQLRVGKIQLTVIHTPGHTLGGVCFYDAADRCLFSGDTLFQGSMGRVDFPFSDPDLMWSSLKKLSSLPLDTKVYPGHGGPTTLEAEKWIANPEDRFI